MEETQDPADETQHPEMEARPDPVEERQDPADETQHPEMEQRQDPVEETHDPEQGPRKFFTCSEGRSYEGAGLGATG